MIAGIGVDIAEISRFKKMMDRYGNRFIERILTPDEVLEFKKRGCSVNYLASRFAAKEAASKALGTGIACGISFQMIEITNMPNGKPELQFYKVAADRANTLSIRSTHLSLSDEKHYCVAMVVLEQ